MGVKNRWVGNEPQIVSGRMGSEPASKGGFFEGVGDVLFGWTKHLFPAEEKKPASPTPPMQREFKTVNTETRVTN